MASSSPASTRIPFNVLSLLAGTRQLLEENEKLKEEQEKGCGKGKDEGYTAYEVKKCFKYVNGFYEVIS